MKFRSLRNRIAFLALLLCAAAPLAHAAQPRAEAPSVLFVVSSEGRREGDAARPGFEMDELAQAWTIFRDNGVRMSLASPRGGPVEADKYDLADPDNARLLADPDAVAMLRHSQRIADIKASGFDAIYVVGGKGAMFDLATDPALSALIAAVHDRGKVVAAICHGSAALANVRLADGSFLVHGRRVTGFSAEEEALFGKRWSGQFPFQLEDTLRARGGRWIESAVMMPGVAVDGRLVTGQNPYSTARVAEAVVRALGIAPAPRQPRRDEASLALVARAVNADASAHEDLAAAPARFRADLIAVIGHYQLQAAQTPQAVRAALAAMDLAAPHVQADELSLSRADAMGRLGRIDEARRLLGQVLAARPDMPEARALERKLAARP